MGEFAEEAVTVEEVAAALNLFHAYNPSKDLHLLRTLGPVSYTHLKFLQIASQELREPYFLSWIHTDPHSPYYFAKVKRVHG